jgi:membrane fusion protein, multidrug efflux system
MHFRSCRIWFLCFVLLPASGTGHSAEEPAKIPEVPVARPVVREVTDHEDFTGRTEASTRVDLKPRVTGYLTTALFKEGDQVKKGDVLFEVDPRPYQAQLDLALSQVDLSKATLRLARATLARDQAVAKSAPGSVSPLQLDQDQAAVDEALARVKAAEAGAEVCKLNLSFCKVTAAISGQIGRRQVDPGNLVNQDQTLLGVLVVPDPMYVSFDVDERTFLRLRRLMPEGKVETGKLPVAVGLADEEGFSLRGVLESHDSQVNAETGAIRMRTVLANKDRLLAPGMFVRVRLALSAPYKALLVSDRAIASDQGLKYVYVLDAENKVQYRRVATGPLQPDDLRVITEGLKPDDRVVGGRLAELRPGMTVRPQEADKPAPKPSQPSQESSSSRGQAGSGILVETTYAGASAEIVSDSVRSPIEQQVTGLENVRYMRSRCTNDGKYAHDVNLAPGVELGRAQVLVQNRVALAVPQLPRRVQDAGVNVKRGTAGVLLIVNLFSPDGRYDRIYLGNYASIQIKDELARLAGVGEVALVGSSDYGLRIWLDPNKLDALNLSAGDVFHALQKEKWDGVDPEKLTDLVVKAAESQVVRLRDVTRVELGAGRLRSEAFQDGKPVAALVIYLTGDVATGKVRAAVRKKLAEIRARLPEGLDLDVAFDFTTNLETPERPANPESLLLDLDFPADSAESTVQILKRSEALLRQMPGVQHVLALSENPFDLFGGRPCLLVRLSPAEQRKTGSEEVVRTIRSRLGALEDVTARLRDLSAPGCFPRCGYPFDLALYGPDAARVRQWAGKLAERLERSKKLADVWANTDSVPRPGRFVDVNREIAAARGVALADVWSTIEIYAGALPVNHINHFGRIWRAEVQAQPGSGDWARDLGKLKVRNAKGAMVPLGAFVTVREVESPVALDFLDMWPMVEITANPRSVVSLEAGQKLCTMLADEVHAELGLTAEYRLTWLQGIPKGK